MVITRWNGNIWKYWAKCIVNINPTFFFLCFWMWLFGNLINLVQYFRLVFSAHQSAEAEQWSLCAFLHSGGEEKPWDTMGISALNVTCGDCVIQSEMQAGEYPDLSQAQDCVLLGFNCQLDMTQTHRGRSLNWGLDQIGLWTCLVGGCCLDC